MSGGDRSGGGGGSGGGDGGADCASLRARTLLNSPVPKVLETLQKDQVLTLDLLTHGPHPIVVARADQEIAGSITFSGVAKLVGCMREGWKFIGLVISVDDGECELEIRLRGRR